MDFTFDEDQLAVGELAARIFGDRMTHERVREVEASAERFDRALWKDLAQANLLGVALDAERGGIGLGVTGLALVLEQQGRRVAPVPLLWGAVAASVAPVETAAAWAEGSLILTAALAEPGAGDPLSTSVTLEGGRLDGTKVNVPFAHVAGQVVLIASSEKEPVVVLADLAGVSAERVEATNREILTHLHFEQTPAVQLDADARSIVDVALVGLAALQLGVAEEALAQAAAYTSTRHQFGKPLSSFQSTLARAADAFIDIEAMRATLWQAAWRIDQGLHASLEVEVAKWWASEAGQRVVHATQHLHGGIGADIEYPIHRYFLWGKQIEDTLGGGSAHLARVGRELAGR